MSEQTKHPHGTFVAVRTRCNWCGQSVDAEAINAVLSVALERIERRADIKDGDDPRRECAHILAEARAALQKAKGAE